MNINFLSLFLAALVPMVLGFVWYHDKMFLKPWMEATGMTKEKMNRILAENTGRSYEDLVRDTDRDNWMTAEEAKAYGLIDQIYTTRKEIAAK